MNITANKMAEILRRAYANPSEPGVFYSANGGETGSARLNAMPCWDWTPAKSVYVRGVTTALFPIALGCPPVMTSEGSEWIEPLITDPAVAREFSAPCILEGRSGQILREVAAMTESLSADELIMMPDIQSPLGIAELMWDDSFYISLMEEPEAMHHLLEQITRFQIEFILEVKRIAGPRLNAVGFPAIWGTNDGVMVADDTMSLISPPMHLEFSVPYLNQLSEACGGLYYHSCTWREPYFDNIRQIQGARAYNWNPGNSTDPAAIITAFSGRAVLTPHICRDMHQDNDLLPFGFADEVELVRYMLDNRRPDTSLYFWFSNVTQKGDIIERIYDLLDERGLTPRAHGIF